MRTPYVGFVAVLSVAVLIVCLACAGEEGTATPTPTATPTATGLGQSQVELPEVKLDGNVSLEQTLLRRRSVRDYADAPLALEEVSQLLWAAQGITAHWGGRTAPSAGALYPLEVYLVAGEVEGLSAGVYRYHTDHHALALVKGGDVRNELAVSALSQSAVKDAAADIVISAVYERTTGKYGDRGVRYVHMEAGHAAQNVYLQATALNLGAVTIGAFLDSRVKEVLEMPEDEHPLYIIPVGRLP